MSMEPYPQTTSEFLSDIERVWLNVDGKMQTHSQYCYRWHERCAIARLIDLLREVENPERPQ